MKQRHLKSTDINKIQLGEVVSFITVTYRNMGEKLLKGLEITQIQLPHQSPSHHGCHLTKARNLEHTVQSAGSREGWRVSCPGGFLV